MRRVPGRVGRPAFAHAAGGERDLEVGDHIAAPLVGEHAGRFERRRDRAYPGRAVGRRLAGARPAQLGLGELAQVCFGTLASHVPTR